MKDLVATARGTARGRKQAWRQQEELQEEERQRRQQEKYPETERRQQETQERGQGEEEQREKNQEATRDEDSRETTRDETGREQLALLQKMIQSEEPTKNEEGDTTAAALREANLRIDTLNARVQALEEADGKITTSRSSSSETEGETWNWKWHNGSWWFRAGPRVNSRQRRSIARMVQRVEM